MKKVVFNIYSIILLMITFVMLTPASIYRPPGMGLDPSWNIGINLAISKGLIFGQDFIFTYGPLGYLHTRLPIGISKIEYVIGDAFLLLNIGIILFYVFRNIKTYLGIFLVFLCVLVYTRAYPRIEFTLLWIFLFFLFHYLKHGTRLSLSFAFLWGLILFYVKVNTGLVALVLMLFFLFYRYFLPKRDKRVAVLFYGLAYTLILFLSAIMLRTDLIGYVRGAVHITSAYNDAMFLAIGDNPYGILYLQVALVIILLWGAAFALNIKHYLKNKDALLQYLFVSSFIFIIFKQGFVRADIHILFFFQHISIAIGLLALFSVRKVNRYLLLVLIVSLILSFPYATGLYSPNQISNRLKTITLTEVMEAPLKHISNKFKGFVSYLNFVVDAKTYDRHHPNLDGARLSEEILETIGSGTVDVVPWEISYIYANDLHYNPRPVIQSYSAYNDYLDVRNFEKYVSDSAPDFILLKTDEIDGWHPFVVESKTKLAILAHYEVAEKYDELLLLKRREYPLNFSTTPSIQMQAELGDYIDLENTDHLQYLSADVEYSLMGKIVRFFFQPPVLRVTVQLESGEERSFKAIKTIIGGEILVNRLVDSIDSAEDYFRSGGRAAPKVVKIEFDTPDRWGFKPEFTYRVQHVTLAN